MELPQLVNWVEINLTTLQNNIKRIQEISARPMMAVLKANAYGHGLVEIGRAASAAGVHWFAVARLEEALQLRRAGIDRSILVLGYTQPTAVPIAQAHTIHLTVYERDTAEAYSQQCNADLGPLSIHAKIDSGMGRLGIFPEEAAGFIDWLKHVPGLALEGVFTHFARADEPAELATQIQIERFDRLVKTLESCGLRPPIVHAANSGATLAFASAAYDVIRPGILMYGLSPSSQVALPDGIHPILEWKTRLTSVKTLPAGHGVSYGHEYVTRGEECIGALAVGYADGFRRTRGNEVLLNGKHLPVVGRVCMDQCMVRLDSQIGSRAGDEVVLLGRQGEARISAEDIAARWGTINYEVLAGIANRVNRVYIR